MSEKLDVLGQLANIAELIDNGNPCFIGESTDNFVYAKDVLALREAVAELIRADKALDFAKLRKIEADNRIVRGDRSDDAFVKQASANHSYDRAIEDRRAALAKVSP